MRENTIARSYAAALFELARKHGHEQSYADAFDALGRLLEAEPRIRHFLETPKLDAAVKKQALRQALERRVPDEFLRFVQLVVDKDRQRLLGAMAREYGSLLDEHLGRVHADVTLAREPDEVTVREIAEGLGESLGREVVPHVRVNPEILGGVVVRYGDRVLDGSLRRQLLSLRRALMAAELPVSAGSPQ